MLPLRTAEWGRGSWQSAGLHSLHQHPPKLHGGDRHYAGDCRGEAGIQVQSGTRMGGGGGGGGGGGCIVFCL